MLMAVRHESGGKVRTLLTAILDRMIRIGTLTVRFPDGTIKVCAGKRAGPNAGFVINDDGIIRGLILDPGMAFGEGYMDGRLAPYDCTLYEVLDLLFLNMEEGWSHPMGTVRNAFEMLFRRLAQFNPARRARRNVAHHYDLNGRLYSLFLDRDRQYSCAYFPRGDETLEEAQRLKKRHIAAKLRLDRPDLTVLDIGSGWGGMALMLAQEYGAHVTGITLSTEQLAEARARAAAAGLADRVTFELMDYRSMTQRFDRIVSVGMFEHVGLGHYRTFFDVVRRCLADDGVALVHAIGRSHGPGSTSPWLAKYIFPGGYSPALSEVFRVVEKSRLLVTDCEILRLHYAETLRQWRRRFAANCDAIAALYDERFCRMFEFYLSGCELAFRHQGHMVWQIQLARQHAAVPLTRDYIYEAEYARSRAQA